MLPATEWLPQLCTMYMCPVCCIASFASRYYCFLFWTFDDWCACATVNSRSTNNNRVQQIWTCFKSRQLVNVGLWRWLDEHAPTYVSVSFKRNMHYGSFLIETTFACCTRSLVAETFAFIGARNECRLCEMRRYAATYFKSMLSSSF